MRITDAHPELHVVLTDGRLIAIMVLWTVAAVLLAAGAAFANLN